MTDSANFKSFADFYLFYLSEHTNKISRRLHFVGTSLIILIGIFAIISTDWLLLWLLPVVGYGFAWLGHFVFEKNRPATFKHPLYSLMGDFKMWWQVITLKLPL